jgi:hypothetical protein
MIIFINIKNEAKNLDAYIRRWMMENCQKWILLENDTQIFAIFETNSYTRTDSAIRGLKNVKFVKVRKCEFKIELSKNILKTQSITTFKIFKNCLKTYFGLSSDNISNSDEIFKKIELKGFTKKYIFSLFEEKDEKSIISSSLSEEKAINPKIFQCVFCNKEFKNKFCKCRHEEKCKKNEKNTSSNTSPNNPPNDLSNDLSNEVKDLKNMVQNLTETIKTSININKTTNNIQCNVNSNNVNNVNIQIHNNYMSKKDKLNHYFKNMIDIDTFTDNYKNNSKYHLTKDEAQILLENSEKLGIPSYGEGLYTYLKKKYCLQLKDLTGQELKHYESILPFICADINHRSHYEYSDKNGWVLLKLTDKLKKIVDISDKQIYDHHNKFICYPSKKGKITVVNVFLKKADYSEIEQKLESLSMTAQSNDDSNNILGQ